MTKFESLVDVQTGWNEGIVSLPIDSRTQRKHRTPGQPDVHGSLSGNRYSSVKEKVLSGTADLIDGWREPTLFRGYVCKINPGEDFEYETVISGQPGTHRGTGYPYHSNAIWAGVVGSGRYPCEPIQDDFAIQKMMYDLNRGELQLGVALAEFNKTLLLLSNSIMALQKFMKEAFKFLTEKSNRRRSVIQMVIRTPATRSGRRKVAKALGKVAANRWLEYQYGWKPLMSDIYGLAGEVTEIMRKKHRIVARANVSVAGTPNGTLTKPSAGLIYINADVRNGARARSDWEVRFAAAAVYNRLGLINILEVAWELIPFSFVLDWAAPIGQFLGQLNGMIGLTFLGGSLTRYTTANVHVRWTHYPFISGKPIDYTVESVSWFRYPLSHNMLATPILLTNPFSSVQRLATALALLNSRSYR